MYTAVDDRTLYKAAFMASIILTVFTVALAMAGMVSYLAYPEGDLFFAILIDMGRGWQVLIIIVIAMLASGVSDSLQVGIAAELTTCFPKLTLLQARIICGKCCCCCCVLLTVGMLTVVCCSASECPSHRDWIPAVRHHDSLPDRRLAVHDCCGAHAAGHVEACNSRQALAGNAAGFLTVFIYGVIAQGKFVGGFNWFVLPEDSTRRTA